MAPEPGLRPTPDRLRETLFNWMAVSLPGARCLDLFAGSGALGFEALSRGAGEAVLVERGKRAVGALERNRAALGATAAEIVHGDALEWLETARQQFDMVFVDPPFHQGLAQRACELLANRGHLAPSAHVYAETEREAVIATAGLRTIKQARAGQVKGLLQRWTPGMSE